MVKIKKKKKIIFNFIQFYNLNMLYSDTLKLSSSKKIENYKKKKKIFERFWGIIYNFFFH